MRPKINSYPVYKNSKLPWLEKVPAHWEESRTKCFFREVDERSITGQEELLSVSHVTGVTPRSQKNVTMFMAESNVGHKICRPGDLVINTMWAWMAALGVAKQAGLVSPSYGVYRPIKNSRLIPEYVDLLLRTQHYAAEYFCRSTGIRTSRLRLYPDRFLDIPILCPPEAEQLKIVQFIKIKRQQIRQFIQAKRRHVDLISEQIDNEVEDAQSGNENWPLVKLGHYVDLLPGFAFPSPGFTHDNKDIRLLRGVNIGPGGIRWKQVVRWPSTDVDRFSRYLLEPGDIVIGMDRPWISTGIRVATVSEGDVPAILLQRVARLRPKHGLLSDYLVMVLNRPGFRTYFEPILTGVSVPHISPEQICGYRFPLPPLDVQYSILDRLRILRESALSSIYNARLEASLIDEYRTRLIADVVTGKVDVREATDRLQSSEELKDLDDEPLGLSELDPEQVDDQDDEASDLISVADED